MDGGREREKGTMEEEGGSSKFKKEAFLFSFARQTDRDSVQKISTLFPIKYVEEG